MPSQSDMRFRNTSHPILYEVNTRVLLNELSKNAGRKLTLGEIPDALLDEWASLGFDGVWMMGVWTTGKLGVQIAREHEGLSQEYKRVLSDLTDDDVIGSPYAVRSYTVARSLGGAKALDALRKKLAERGLGLVLDFVANHVARDNAWISEHPEYFIGGQAGEEESDPDNFFSVKTTKGQKTLAFGRDPYFPGWTDTAQLNPRHPAARRKMIEALLSVAKQCDGVRCDMAMLVLNEVFQNTWRHRSHPADAEPEESEFWADAIRAVRNGNPEFLFLAEAYWNLEWPLQELGFDYTYDKRLYDRLLREGASAVYEHLKAEVIFQRRSARFLENHDEERVAHVLPSEAWQFAAATIASTVPGMLLLHEGQLEGRRVKVPVQLGRRPNEEVSMVTRNFYSRLLSCLSADVIKHGEWRLHTVRPAWSDNYSYQNVLSYSWRKGVDYRIIVVNYAPLNSQCYIDLNFDDLKGTAFEFRDLMSPAVYSRERAGIQLKGMYFDLPGYGLHIFDVKAVR